MAGKIIPLTVDKKVKVSDSLSDAKLILGNIAAIADLVANADQQVLDPDTIENAMCVIRGEVEAARNLISLVEEEVGRG